FLCSTIRELNHEFVVEIVHGLLVRRFLGCALFREPMFTAITTSSIDSAPRDTSFYQRSGGYKTLDRWISAALCPESRSGSNPEVSYEIRSSETTSFGSSSEYTILLAVPLSSSLRINAGVGHRSRSQRPESPMMG